MDIKKSLELTSHQLKFDYDGTNPEWFILCHLFNVLYFYFDAVLTLSSSGKGYHVYVPSQPSSLNIRRFHREDKGRIWCTEMRSSLLNVTEDHDIIYQRKGTFKVLETKHGLIFKWTRQPKGDSEPLTIRDLTVKPFLSKIDFHRKRRIRWWKRKKGKLKERRRQNERARVGFED